jgi:hypothetical protein
MISKDSRVQKYHSRLVRNEPNKHDGRAPAVFVSRGELGAAAYFLQKSDSVKEQRQEDCQLKELAVEVREL